MNNKEKKNCSATIFTLDYSSALPFKVSCSYQQKMAQITLMKGIQLYIYRKLNFTFTHKVKTLIDNVYYFAL